MKGYRTMIFAFLQLAAGVATWAGYTIDEQTITDLAGHLDTILGATLAVTGIITAVLRLRTDTPVGGQR